MDVSQQELLKKPKFEGKTHLTTLAGGYTIMVARCLVATNFAGHKRFRGDSVVVATIAVAVAGGVVVVAGVS